MGLIYKITNKINGKIYIGQTTRNFEDRWKEHCKDSINEKSFTYFHRAIKKYGIENFKKEIIEDNIDNDIILDVESYYIETLKSNDKNIGYNMTLDGKYCEKKIKDNDIVNMIINDIKNTDMNFVQIGIKYSLSNHIISSINKGLSYKKENIEYPIRNINITRLLTKDEVLKIIKLLQTTKISMPDIAKIYDIHRMTVTKINNGKTYNKYTECLNLDYPIRKEQSKELSWDYVENIVYKELLDKNNQTLTDIANKLGVSINTISRINTGKSHKEHLLKKYPNIVFPIKKMEYEKKISDDKIIYEIVELLKYTSLTLQQIIYFIKNKYGNDLTNSLYKINSGKRYKSKIENMFNNIIFPIREQSNKRIIFTNIEQIIKENEIFSKYNLILENLPLSYGEKE